MSTPVTPAPRESAPDGSGGALRLLDREPPEDYLREWTERIAAERTAAGKGTECVLIFRIGSEWLGLSPRVLRQVAALSPVRSLPHRRDGIVKGLVNIRGELTVCVSLGAALGLERGTAEETGRGGLLLVISGDGGRLAFPVDEAHGMHRYHPAELRPLPATLSENRVTCTAGLLAWGDRTVGCLDDGLLFHTLNRSLA